MPPKPKGLKASKRSAPFDPSSATTSTEEQDASPSSTANANERTYPLDEDCLTLSDLFELRLTVLELLYPFPTDLFISQSDPEKLDEARSFLRGILHGCAVLEQYVPRSAPPADGGHDNDDDDRSETKVEERRKLAGKEKLEALGLGPGGGSRGQPIVEGLITYLQGWSLHQLGEIFVDPKQGIKTAALKIGGGGGRGGGSTSNKKRKIDLNEPRTKIEWLEAGHAKYRYGHDQVSKNYDGDGDEDHLVMTLTNADFIRCKTSLARCYFDEGDVDKAKDMAKDCGRSGLGDRACEDMWAIGLPEHECLEGGDGVLAQLRAWAEVVSFIEKYSRNEGEEEDVEALESAVNVLEWDDLEEALDQFESSSAGKAKEQAGLWKWLRQVVIADAKMVSFIKLEDALEAKYRPEDDDDNVAEDGDEGEVKELPMDAADVKLAKKAGEEAVSALRETISAFSALASSVAHPAGKDSQYRKLEEVLLISSALVNPSDKEGTAKIEAEIEKVRKDGGLDDDNEEEEETAEEK